MKNGLCRYSRNNSLVGLAIFVVAFISIIAANPTWSRSQGTPKRVNLYTKLLGDSAIFTLKLDPKEVYFPGRIFTANIHVHHSKSWHIYSSTMSPDAGPLPLSVGVLPEVANDFSLLGLKERGKLTSVFDSNFSATTKAYYGDFDIAATIKIKDQAALGSTGLGLTVNYMTCSENMCLPGRTYAIPMTFLGQKSLTISIVKPPKDSLKAVQTDTTSPIPGVGSITGGGTPPVGSSTPEITAAPTPSAGPVDPNAIAKRSWMEFILAAAGFGVLALLTPCVYPMVPITISFFTKRNAGSKKEAVKDASLYALGIILTFVALGFILALLFGRDAINRFAANPWANLLIASIFIAFALNLFGMFEIGVPASILTRLNSVATTSKNRAFSVIMMGLVFSLASFTCTVPFVSTLMFTFSQGSFLRPLVGMLVYATVFSLPFFLLAIFPSLLKSMPRSGGWMNSVKVVMGFMEIGAALKFFSNVDLVWKWGFFSRDLVLAAWVAIAIMTTVYLLGKFRLSHDSPVERIGALRAVIATVFLSLGVYLYTGLNGHPLGAMDAFLPPAEAQFMTAGIGGANSQSNTQIEWYGTYSDALSAAKKSGKNIFIDFTGYTCTNCRAMESTVFSRPDVKEIFKDYVLARLYTDNGSSLNDSNRDMEESRFSTIALPFYAIMSPQDVPLTTFPGYTPDHEAFKAFLEKHRKAASTATSAGVAMLVQ